MKTKVYTTENIQIFGGRTTGVKMVLEMKLRADEAEADYQALEKLSAGFSTMTNAEKIRSILVYAEVENES